MNSCTLGSRFRRREPFAPFTFTSIFLENEDTRVTRLVRLRSSCPSPSSSSLKLLPHGLPSQRFQGWRKTSRERRGALFTAARRVCGTGGWRGEKKGEGGKKNLARADVNEG